MGNETRATMIEGAIQLLATKGVHGASLLKVLEHTGAPRGSVYHHFPGGKEDLILAALDLTGQRHDRFVERFPRHLNVGDHRRLPRPLAPHPDQLRPRVRVPHPRRDRLSPGRSRSWTPGEIFRTSTGTSPTCTKKSVSTAQPQSAWSPSSSQAPRAPSSSRGPSTPSSPSR